MAPQNNSITLKYQPFFFDKRWQFFPLIKIIIEEKKATGTLALLDSGSTSTFIPRGLAEAIGLLDDKEKIKKSESTGASGKFKTDVTKMKFLKLMKGDTVFDTFNSVLVYIPGEKEKDLPQVVLGRDYIFRRYDITFYESRKKIILTKHNKNYKKITF